VIAGDCDGVVVVLAEIADAVAEEALTSTLYDEFAEAAVAGSRPLPELFSSVGPEAKRDFEAWKLRRTAANTIS
jgi:regulator of RNase E activity RraA